MATQTSKQLVVKELPVRRLYGSRFHTSPLESEAQSLTMFFWDYIRELTGLTKPFQNFYREIVSADKLCSLDCSFDEVLNAFQHWASGLYNWSVSKNIAISFRVEKFVEKAEYQIQMSRRNKKGSVTTQLEDTYRFAIEHGYE